MKSSPLLLLSFLAGSVAAGAYVPKLSVKADLAAMGQLVACKLEIKTEAGDEHSAARCRRSARRARRSARSFGRFRGRSLPLRVSGRRQKVLMASALGESDYEVRYLFGMVDGKLKQVGHVAGQGEVVIPRNGTLVSKWWMGFWSKTDKHVFGKDLTLAQVSQGFYSVDVEGTVVGCFPSTRRAMARALANTREGSKFKVLLGSLVAQDGGRRREFRCAMVPDSHGERLHWLGARQAPPGRIRGAASGGPMAACRGRSALP